MDQCCVLFMPSTDVGNFRMAVLCVITIWCIVFKSISREMGRRIEKIDKVVNLLVYIERWMANGARELWNSMFSLKKLICSSICCGTQWSENFLFSFSWTRIMFALKITIHSISPVFSKVHWAGIKSSGTLLQLIYLIF